MMIKLIQHANGSLSAHSTALIHPTQQPISRGRTTSCGRDSCMITLVIIIHQWLLSYLITNPTMVNKLFHSSTMVDNHKEKTRVTSSVDRTAAVYHWFTNLNSDHQRPPGATLGGHRPRCICLGFCQQLHQLGRISAAVAQRSLVDVGAAHGEVHTWNAGFVAA